MRCAKCGFMCCPILLCLGEFGVVYRGNLTKWGGAREQSLVAVKTLKGMCGVCGWHSIHEWLHCGCKGNQGVGVYFLYNLEV